MKTYEPEKVWPHICKVAKNFEWASWNFERTFQRDLLQSKNNTLYRIRGGFRGGGRGGRTPPPSGIRPPADPKGTPFDTFSEIHFWRTDPKIFLKAPSAPIYTNFEGERAPKKRNFFAKIFQKVPKNGFFDKIGAKTVLWESSKNQFGRPKKKKRSSKFWKIFRKSAPLEKILDPPLYRIKFQWK